MKLFEVLQQRNLIENLTSEELIEKINTGGLTFYAGFDPTANSLHIGHLAVLNFMRIMQKGGHTPIGLVGGATGMIGDPGGKSEERKLLGSAELEENVKGMKQQMEKYLHFDGNTGASIVNNYDWFSKWSYIDFLREVGKHFSVNTMIARDSVKNRIDRDGEGISYTEFSYMILQAFDFLYLSREKDCTLQIGGSEQWGNIVSGIDLTRRLDQKQLYGVTIPLITKADGTKFGKTETGTLWLDEQKTSPYELYQYFMRQPDEDIIRLIKVLTEVPLDEIEELEKGVKNEPHLRAAQKLLAREIVDAVHGAEAADAAIRASKVLFGEKIENLDDALIGEIFKDVPSIEKEITVLHQGWSLVDALVETGLCKSKGQARKLIQGRGAYVNNHMVEEIEMMLHSQSLASESFLVLRSGKKNYRLVRFCLM